MIVIKVELWPGGRRKTRELFRMTLTNDGSLSDGLRGNYDVNLFRRTSDGVLRTGILRRGRVEGFPRKSYHVGRLVLRALKSCFPEEK